MNDALLNDYILKYGKQIPKEILDIPDIEDRLHAIEKFIQENLEIKLTSREEIVKTYLENKRPEEVSPEQFAKQRLEFIKRLLKFKTQSPILELPEMVDKLTALGINQDQAYDLMVEIYGKELGIERTVLPKYYEACKTIDTFVKNKKLDIKISDEVLKILKTRALPAVVAVRQIAAKVSEQKLTFEAAAAAFSSSDEVYKFITQFSAENFTPDQSVQEMFLRHSPGSQANAIFSSIFNYGKDKFVGKVKDAAIRKFIVSEVGKKIATQLGIKITVATVAAPETAGLSLALVVASFVQDIAKNALSWVKRNFKKVAIGTTVTLGFIGGGISWAVGSFVVSYGILNASKVLGTISTGASFVFNLLPELVATEIVWPIVVIIISVPIVIALILFIITNSALVVPFSGSEYYGDLFENDGLTNKSSCPIIMTSSAAGSYNPITQKGHGSNEYWHSLYSDESSMCKYSIPATSGCQAPKVGQDNVCYKKGLTQCDFYGFAMDISSSTSNNISLPQIDGKDVKWNFNNVEYEDSGVGWTYGYTDETGKYSILLKHVNKGMLKGNNLVSGTKLGFLYNQGNNTHLHLEVQVDGRYVRPENYFCNK